MLRLKWSALPLRIKGMLVALVSATPLLLLWVLIGWALVRPPAASTASIRARNTEAALTQLSADLDQLKGSATIAPSIDADLKAVRAAALAAPTPASQRRGQMFLWVFLLSSLAAVGGGMLAALRLIRGITRRIEMAVGAADGLARGELVELPTLGADEIGRLSLRLHEILRLLEGRERELARQNLELATVNEELEAFSYSVSHDLRAPLRSIAGFSQIVAEEAAGVIPPSAVDALDRVRSATARMGVLIDELLKLSRLTRAPLNAQDTDVSALAGEIVERLRRAEPDRRVAVTIAPDLRVEGDPGLLTVMLENLIGNAWKFTSHTDQAEIAVVKQRSDSDVVIAVEDNGAGFDMAHAKMLFSPFQRLHTQREFNGTGIGLTIVYRIARRHGGSVSAEGTVGKGATFTVTLPRAAAGSSI